MTIELKLTNGKSLITDKGCEAYYFLKSDGARIVPKKAKKKQKSGKSQ